MNATTTPDLGASQSQASRKKSAVKKAVFATACASVLMFSLAGLYTGVLAQALISARVDPAVVRPVPNLPLVACGYAFLALLMALLYPKLMQRRASPALAGLSFGMMTGICWMMPYSLVLFGVYRFPYAVLPLDFAWTLVEQGIGGLVVGLIYGKSQEL